MTLGIAVIGSGMAGRAHAAAYRIAPTRWPRLGSLTDPSPSSASRSLSTLVRLSETAGLIHTYVKTLSERARADPQLRLQHDLAVLDLLTPAMQATISTARPASAIGSWATGGQRAPEVGGASPSSQPMMDSWCGHVEILLGEQAHRQCLDIGMNHVLASSLSRSGAVPRLRRASLEPCAQDVERRSGNCFSRHISNRAWPNDVLAWQPEIVHFHSVHIPQNVALAAHLGRAGIPYCVTVHGGLFRAALRRGRLKKTVFNLLFERRYLNEARFIHAVSPHETEVIRRHGVDRPIVVVPNGLPPDANVRASRPDALYAESPWLRDRQVFMFIGRLDPWQKGLDLLIEAFAHAGLREAALVLVGPDCRGSRRTLATLADRLGILSQLVFTGPAFGQDRANLFAAADVFVHPSRWEGLSLSVLAAAAAGKPCLITREADPLGELERAQAAVIVEANVSSIAAGLRRAATLSGDELHTMGTRAKRVAETHFTWPAIAERLVAAYRSTLDPGGRSHRSPDEILMSVMCAGQGEL